MTIDQNLGKEKIEVDKDKLLMAFYELDELFIETKKENNWKVSNALNQIFMNIEFATGLEYFRTLRKIERKKPELKDTNWTGLSAPSSTATFTLPTISTDDTFTFDIDTKNKNKKKKRGRTNRSDK
jgi:hypothetical protein